MNTSDIVAKQKAAAESAAAETAERERIQKEKADKAKLAEDRHKENVAAFGALKAALVCSSFLPLCQAES